MTRREVVAGASYPLLLLAAGCDLRAKEVGADPLEQIREQVEGQRQCAPLLSGTWPIEFSADALAGPRVDALVAAGLVRRVPLAEAGNDRPRVRIEPTPAGARDVWLRRLDPDSPPEPMLCYGSKHVVAVRPERRNLGAETGPPATGTVLRYDYRIVRSPAWTARADVRAAYPFLPRELERVRTAQQAATRSGERWILTSDTGPDAGAELAAEEGFLPG